MIFVVSRLQPTKHAEAKLNTQKTHFQMTQIKPKQTKIKKHNWNPTELLVSSHRNKTTTCCDVQFREKNTIIAVSDDQKLKTVTAATFTM